MSKLTATGTQRECTTHSALENARLMEAGRQFTQANNTPCFQTPIWEIFGELGINWKEFDQVLEGTFEPPNLCDPFTKKCWHISRDRQQSDQIMHLSSQNTYTGGRRLGRKPLHHIQLFILDTISLVHMTIGLPNLMLAWLLSWRLWGILQTDGDTDLKLCWKKHQATLK